MTPPGRRLPIRPQIQPCEDITSYITRCAQTNHLTLADLTGHPRLTRMSEDPPERLLRELAQRTGTPATRLRQATLAGAFPGACLDRARTGRRWSGQPATCPSCGVPTVGARLNLVVLCPRCDTLLADDHDPAPLPPPSTLASVQAEVFDTLAYAARSKVARARLQRLEALMRAQEPAVWTNWPPLLHGESPEWRARAVRFAGWAITPGVITARPPSVTATLLALTWPFSTGAAATRERIDSFAFMSETWRPADGDLPSWRTEAEARDGLRRLLHRAGIGFEQLPTTVRLPEDPIVLPPYLHTTRTAEAIALAMLTPRHHHRPPSSVREVAARQRHSVSERTLRIATRMMTSPTALRYLAAHATRIHPGPPRDLHRLRGELSGVTSVPPRVTAGLPTPARDHGHVGEVAAAWVWLDATLGRPAGGPHPHLSRHTLVDFDRDLNPEGRLTLRQWWQQRTTPVTDDTTLTGREEQREGRAG